MGTLRFDHVGVVVDDLDAVAAFFLDLGFEREGGTLVEGESVDEINGLDGVRAEVMMVRAPDGSGTLELVKYHAPADNESAHPSPANRLGFRHIAIEVTGSITRTLLDWTSITAINAPSWRRSTQRSIARPAQKRQSGAVAPPIRSPYSFALRFRSRVWPSVSGETRQPHGAATNSCGPVPTITAIGASQPGHRVPESPIEDASADASVIDPPGIDPRDRSGPAAASDRPLDRSPRSPLAGRFDRRSCLRAILSSCETFMSRE
ncbi:VOC family protein [Halosolutus gelatinilyticus]|uniref:VOC family protein n=1 Tax=Halosolutus gelatinilyticus TaxID=2931975 RepID=UPI001FF5E8D2|nr:VOC family protein [Halosolutus gelatinilyticus]